MDTSKAAGRVRVRPAPWTLGIVLVMTFALGQPAIGDDPPRGDASRSEPAEEARVARGKYLVHHVAMCVICHSERDEAGNVGRTRLLRGGRIPVSPADGDWAARAPKLVGRPVLDRKLLVELLTTGVGPNGRPNPRPPMPPFRMTKQDAEAVAAYIHSLD